MTKKNTSFLLFVVIFVITAFICVNFIDENVGCSSSSANVDEYQATITLDSDGDMYVSERFITSGFEEFFYRDLDYTKYNKNNDVYYQSTSNKAYINIYDVEVRIYDENENDITNSLDIDRNVTCEPSSSTCKSIKTSANPGSFTSKTTFEYNYTIENAATKYSDISEINWVLFNSSDFSVSNVNVLVNLPSGEYDLSEDFYVYCYGTSNGEWIKDESKKSVTITASKMRKNEVIEFRIMMPNEALSGVLENDTNYVVNNGVNKDIILSYSEELVRIDNIRITIANVFYYGSFVLIIAMVFITLGIYKKYDKEYKPKFDLDIYRELPASYGPAIMGYMYRFGTTKDEDVTATLMDLIRNGYLKLDQNDENIMDDDANFKVIRTNNDLKDLLPHEQFLINWFINTIGDGSSVTLKQIENYPKNYKNAEKFQNDGRQFSKLVKAQALTFDFFENVKTGKAKAMLFALIPLSFAALAFILSISKYNIDVTFALIVSIMLTVVYAIYVGTIKKRSINGIEDYAKWKAFRQFLLEFTSLEDYPMPSLIIWEHYLVYAISFDIADKVMEQLRVKLPLDEEVVQSSTYIGYGYRNRSFSYGYAVGRMNRSMSSARTTSYNTIAAHNASRSGGGGGRGGFGGGSSFGGGGGGIRGR